MDILKMSFFYFMKILFQGLFSNFSKNRVFYDSYDTWCYCSHNKITPYHNIFLEKWSKNGFPQFLAKKKSDIIVNG